MKKPFSNSSAFAFLFVMAAVTPQSVWASKCEPVNGRKPASDEQINCLKEEKDKLEKDMIKLVEDKAKILKQLEELKSSKKQEKEEDKKEEKKTKKEIVENRDQDMADLMGYFTYMLLNQQEQQQNMMNRMFSYMTQSMQQFVYPSYYSNMSSQYDSHILRPDMYDDSYSMRRARMNPYSLESLGEGFGYHHARMNPYSLESLGDGFGIGISHAGHSSYRNPYEPMREDYVRRPYRYPAEEPMKMQRMEIAPMPNFHGYDFGAAPSMPQQQQPQSRPSTLLEA